MRVKTTWREAGQHDCHNPYQEARQSSTGCDASWSWTSTPVTVCL